MGPTLSPAPMPTMRCLSLFALLLASSLAAQVDRDSFAYPDGPVVPGWTQQRGTWQVRNGRLSATSGALWAYITKDGLAAVDSVLDGEFFISGTGLQFAGLTARHPGTNLDANLLMTKVQDNSGASDFDRIYVYERPANVASSLEILGGTLHCRGRMVTLDNEVWMEVDADLDGVYELASPARLVSTVLGTGLVGMSGYQTAEMDDFEFFDAVLLPQVGAVPHLGADYTLRLDTPTPNVPWVGLLSLGNAGIPLDAPRALPLTLDALFTVSLGIGLTGLTDSGGKATFAVPIPNDTGLVGLGVYAGAVTVDATKPFAIGHIANESFFRIEP